MVRYMLVKMCAHCDDVIPFDIIEELGFNPGLDGHLFKSKEAAEAALGEYLITWETHPIRGIVNGCGGVDPWTRPALLFVTRIDITLLA